MYYKILMQWGTILSDGSRGKAIGGTFKDFKVFLSKKNITKIIQENSFTKLRLQHFLKYLFIRISELLQENGILLIMIYFAKGKHL